MSDPSPEPRPSYRFGRLLLIVGVAFLLSGFDTRWASIMIGLLTVALVLVAFRTTSLRTTSPRLAVLTLVATAGVVITVFVDRGSAANAVPAFAQTVLMSILLVLVVAAVVRSEVIDTQTIVGAITAYAMIGMAFASLYAGIDLIDDAQVSIPNTQPSQYPEFSFVVLTTLGFGNQTPTAPLSARIVVLQAMGGQIFLTVFIARLVSLYRRPRFER